MVVKEFSETPWEVNAVYAATKTKTVDTLLTFWLSATPIPKLTKLRVTGAARGGLTVYVTSQSRGWLRTARPCAG